MPGDQVRSLRAGLRPVAGPRPHVRGQLALGDRPAARALLGLRHVLGDLRRRAGSMSVTWWRRCAATGSPARPAPHPRHSSGGYSNRSSGSSTRLIVVPGSPGCFPGRRFPRSRKDRSRGSFFPYGLSDDGGLDDVDESLAACRSSCSTRAVSSAISRYASASRAASSACGNAESSSAEGTPDTSGTTGNHHHPGPPVNNPPRRVAAIRPTHPATSDNTLTLGE